MESAAHTPARSPRPYPVRKSIESPMRRSCAKNCASAVFHTRPTAVKYPDRALESASAGSEGAAAHSARTERASPIQRKPIGSARRKRMAAALSPKKSA